MTTSIPMSASLPTAVPSVTTPQQPAAPTGRRKTPFVAPLLTRQGRVATITQDDNEGGSGGDDDDDGSMGDG